MEYIITYSICLFLLKISQQKGKVYIFFILLSILLLSLLAGLRDLNIGTDTSYYVEPLFSLATQCDSITTFLLFYSEAFDIEILYALYNYIVSTLTDNVNLYLFSAHFLLLSVLFAALYRMRDRIELWIGGAILFFLFFSSTLNTIRQCFAISFLLLSYTYFVRNKYVKTIALFFLACGFHSSAFIFLFVFLIYWLIERYSFLTKATYKVLAFIIIGVVFFYMSYFVELLVGMGVLDSKYQEMYLTSDIFGTNLPVSLLALNIFNIAFVSYCHKKLKDQETVFCEYICYISFISCFLGLYSTFAVRIGAYFLWLTLLLLPILIKKCCNSVFVAIYILFIVCYWFMSVVVAGIDDTYPYTSEIIGI